VRRQDFNDVCTAPHTSKRPVSASEISSTV
jgi:hypothetical protein